MTFFLLIVMIFIISVDCVTTNQLASEEQHEQLIADNLKSKQSKRQLDHLQLIRASYSKFMNQKLIISVIIREPFVIYNPPATIDIGSVNASSGQLNKWLEKHKEDLDNYSGVAIEVTKRLVEIFKLNVRVIIPSDRQFGVQDAKTGKWTGLLGSLVRNESDLGVTALSITSKRAEYVDFTRAYYVETSSILLKTPEEIQDFLVIFEPFSPIVWCLLFVTILWLIVVITIMTKLEDNQKLKHEIARSIRQHLRQLNRSRSFKRRSSEAITTIASMMIAQVLTASSSGGSIQEEEDQANEDVDSRVKFRQDSLVNTNMTNETKLSLGQHDVDVARLKAHLLAKSEFGTTWLDRFYYGLTCVLNILLNKDIKHPPRQSPIRILVCVWWLATIVIVNFYLGTLFEQLVLPRRQKLIDTLEELVNQDKIGWGATQGSALHELFLNAQEKSVYWQIGQRMDTVGSADEGVKRVIDTNFAFIRERSILKVKLAQEHRRMGACKMQLAKEEFFSVGFGLALRKNSPYLEAFNAALTLMIENGFVARWQSEYWPQKSRFTECQSTASPNEAEPLSLKHFLSIFLVWASFIGLAFMVLVYQHGKAASLRLLDSQQRQID